MRPNARKGLGFLFLILGIVGFLGGQQSRDEGDRATANKLTGFGVLFGVFGTVLLATGFLRDYIPGSAGPTGPSGHSLPQTVRPPETPQVAAGTPSQSLPQTTTSPDTPRVEVGTADLAIRVADAYPDLYAYFSSDAVFRSVLHEVDSGNLIRAIKTIRANSRMGLADAKELGDRLTDAVKAVGWPKNP